MDDTSRGPDSRTYLLHAPLTITYPPGRPQRRSSGTIRIAPGPGRGWSIEITDDKTGITTAAAFGTHGGQKHAAWQRYHLIEGITWAGRKRASNSPATVRSEAREPPHQRV